MPQMMPMSWFFLFIVISFSWTLYSTLIFFSHKYPSTMINTKTISNKKLNWLW